jgi:hypothetical protein
MVKNKKFKKTAKPPAPPIEFEVDPDRPKPPKWKKYSAYMMCVAYHPCSHIFNNSHSRHFFNDSHSRHFFNNSHPKTVCSGVADRIPLFREHCTVCECMPFSI